MRGNPGPYFFISRIEIGIFWEWLKAKLAQLGFEITKLLLDATKVLYVVKSQIQSLHLT